ncbi:MAG: NACHT domain-containing protein [Ktedonobacteraceae bacterium]
MRQKELWQRYRQQMREEHGKTSSIATFFSAQKGNGLAPATIFIEPEIALTPNAISMPGQQEMLDAFGSRRPSIWTLLLSTSPIARHYMLIGVPGSGKTTVLEHIALSLAGVQSLHHQRIPDILPVFLSLQDSATLIESRANFSLVDAVCEHMQRRWRQTVPRAWVHELVTTGQCVILLDGLDAVADPLTRKHTAAWVQQQMRLYQQHWFIVATRSQYDNELLLDEARVLEIRPFTMEQIEQYVQRWSHVHMVDLCHWSKARREASRQRWVQDFLRQLRATPSLRTLAANPLHLRLLTLVYQHRQILPAQREKLYMEALDIFLEQVKSRKGMQECTLSQAQETLAFLAWSMLQEGKSEISMNEAHQILVPYLAQHAPLLQPDVFLNMIHAGGDVFLKQEAQLYRFAHRTFQEYFAAVYAREQGLEQVLARQIGNSWWHEAIHAFCTQADATYLLQSCLEYPTPPASVLALIGACLEDADFFQPSLRVQIEHLLEGHLEDPNPAKRQIAAKARLRKRIRAMIALEKGTYIDTSLVTCAEYQLFLDAQQREGRYCQPDHWQTAAAPEGQSREPVLGVRATDARAFCQWLTENDQEGWLYRLPLQREWDRLENSENCFLVKLPPETGCWIGSAADTTLRGSNLPSFDILKSKMQAFVAGDWSRQSVDFADFARPLRLAHQLARFLACDLERDLAPDLALAFRRLQVCDLEQSFALAHTWSDILKQMQSLAQAHTSDLLRALVGDLSGTTTASESTRMFKHVRGLTSLLVSANNVSHALLSLLGQALARHGSNSVLSRHREEDVFLSDDGRTLLLASLRSCTLLLTCSLRTWENIFFSEDVTRWFQQFLRGKEYADLDKDAIEQAIAGYLDLYVTLVILELRRQEQIPAWEGILLVKERGAQRTTMDERDGA